MGHHGRGVKLYPVRDVPGSLACLLDHVLKDPWEILNVGNDMLTRKSPLTLVVDCSISFDSKFRKLFSLNILHINRIIFLCLYLCSSVGVTIEPLNIWTFITRAIVRTLIYATINLSAHEAWNLCIISASAPAFPEASYLKASSHHQAVPVWPSPKAWNSKLQNSKSASFIIL